MRLSPYTLDPAGNIAALIAGVIIAVLLSPVIAIYALYVLLALPLRKVKPHTIEGSSGHLS